MGDEHLLSDDGRGIVCPGLESAAPSLAGEGSGTIHLLKIASAPKGFQVKLEVVRRHRA
jgi:hypothetical protein